MPLIWWFLSMLGALLGFCSFAILIIIEIENRLRRKGKSLGVDIDYINYIFTPYKMFR